MSMFYQKHARRETTQTAPIRLVLLLGVLLLTLAFGGTGVVAGAETEESHGIAECMSIPASPAAMQTRMPRTRLTPAAALRAHHEIPEHPARSEHSRPLPRLRGEYASWGGIGTPPR